ncbi:hypothetical protein D3C76_746970 [compost metagenome]
MIAQGQRVVEIVLEGDGETIGSDCVLIQVLPTMEIFRIDTGQHSAVTRRQAVVGLVAFTLVEVTQRQARGFAQAEGQRGCDAPALLIDLFAPGYIIAMGHEVETEHRPRCQLMQRLIGIEGQPTVAISANTRSQASEGLGLGLLADHIDRASGGTGATEDRVGPLDDFDAFQVEGVGAIHLRAVTQAIDLHIGIGAEAADVDAVTRTTASLPRIEGNTGDIRQGLAQAQYALLAHHPLGDNGNGLRHIQKRYGVFVRSRVFGAVTWLGLRLNLDPLEYCCLACLFTLRHGRHRTTHQGHTQCRRQSCAQ